MNPSTTRRKLTALAAAAFFGGVLGFFVQLANTIERGPIWRPAPYGSSSAMALPSHGGTLQEVWTKNRGRLVESERCSRFATMADNTYQSTAPDTAKMIAVSRIFQVARQDQCLSPT